MSEAKSDASFASPSMTEIITKGKLISYNYFRIIDTHHTWGNGVVFSSDRETSLRHLGPESCGVVGDLLDKARVFLQHVKYLKN